MTGTDPSHDDDLERVLADGEEARDARVMAAYDAIATRYADELRDELERKPFDRWMLERIATLAGGRPIADVGCGPGHVTAALALSGADSRGYDFSPGMVSEARRRFPHVVFEVANMRDLPPPPSSDGWGAIVAWYAMVHMAPSELPRTIGALAERLAPDGWLALSLHLGPEVRHLTAWWDRPVDVEFVLHREGPVLHAVTSAGLELVESYARSPLADIEVATRRLYVLARRPV